MGSNDPSTQSRQVESDKHAGSAHGHAPRAAISADTSSLVLAASSRDGGMAILELEIEFRSFRRSFNAQR